MPPKNTTESGTFVKMGTYADSVAIIFEPKAIERGVPGNYGPRDILHADLTIFDKAAIEGGEPLVKKGALITEKGFTTAYADEIGEQMIARLVLRPHTKGGKDFFVPKAVDDAVFDAACAYLEQRDGKVKDLLDGDEPDWA